MSTKRKPCHHCRRRRLRCDASVPFCMKCTTAGIQCPGYGQLLRWSHDITHRNNRKQGQSTRGSKATAENPHKHTNVIDSESSHPQIAESEGKALLLNASPSSSKTGLRPSLPLLDSSIKDFSYSDRYYLSHCKMLTPSHHISDLLQSTIDCARILLLMTSLATTLTAT